MRIKIMAESADHTKMPTPEWSYPIESEEIDEKGQKFQINADNASKEDLARRLNLLALNDLSAKLIATRQNKRVIYVSCHFNAEVVQKCVVTLQPVTDHISEEFEAWFADPDQVVSFARARHERDKARETQERPMLEEQEDPEPIIDGKIDLGELVTQYLSLAINPYPHSPEALAKKEREENSGLASDQERINPFAALKSLKEEKE